MRPFGQYVSKQFIFTALIANDSIDGIFGPDGFRTSGQVRLGDVSRWEEAIDVSENLKICCLVGYL